MTERASRFTVAVVDDDHSILRSLEFLLESADYEVMLFTSATALLDGGCLDDVDCVISDIDMPGIDGFELLGSIHAARPGLPAILITGYPDRVKRSPPLAGTQLRVFTKPFRAEELLVAVGESIRNFSR